MENPWRLEFGARPLPSGGVQFRVWSPLTKELSVKIKSPREMVVPMRSVDGIFSAAVNEIGPGADYMYVIDGTKERSDPVSRFQPGGVHGPSRIVDPDAFKWGDGERRGLALEDYVIDELHIGTFTPEGTWAAAIEQLPHLADVGVTLVEVMPVAEFAGRFGWGYDGVDFFAPTRLYGQPDDFRRFVDAAHRAGLGVMLDVVYNHFGPVGNYLGEFSGDYLSAPHHTDWGTAINYDGENCGPVRELVICNAGYWIDEFHCDGLRLDAVQAIVDDSADSILAALTRQVRQVAGRRKTLVIAENEFQNCRLLRRPDEGGDGLDSTGTTIFITPPEWP